MENETQTAEEYNNENINILMKNKSYRPYEVRNRISNLLEIENRAKIICKLKLFRKLNIVCPYCGWTHS